ncbi:MAG TPA: Bax inhibitor-1/YccA family protein [Tepidisphaeraceae bacterium]|nr:Bax inhibitor-1/YccA family protein [Tepidisphaeraceae bacterium]
MNSVYAWMCAGLALTAVVAWWVSTQPGLAQRIFTGGIFWLIVIAQLALVFTISYAINRISTPAATGLFLLYSALNGLTLSTIFLVYQLNVIAVTFAVTAAMFGAMSLIGFVTKTDLTSLGNFLFMALIGLIIASIVNIFWANSTLYWIVTYAGVAIFLGLTVYDTQRLKQIALQTEGNAALAARLAIVGSLMLYLDFINLFLFLLRIFGSRRD